MVLEIIKKNNTFIICSILGRIIRVTDEVIDYRKWIKDTFPLPVSEGDSLSSSTGSDASTLSAPASDTVHESLQKEYLYYHIFIFTDINFFVYNIFDFVPL